MIRNPQINWSYFLAPFIKFKAWYIRQSWLHIHGLNPERHKMRFNDIKEPDMKTWVDLETKEQRLQFIETEVRPYLKVVLHLAENEYPKWIKGDGVVRQYFNPNKEYLPLDNAADNLKLRKAIDEMWKES